MLTFHPPARIYYCLDRVAYNADDADGYGGLLHLPAADHPPGSVRQIHDWDSGTFLGTIPEANHTYNVVGNMNEHEVVIGETTFGGIGPLASQKGAIMDYGSLIWVTLQRVTTAREAIAMCASLTTEYGYASDGESFSIGDPDEVWLLEFIGKGNFEKGAVWVATRVPDGHVSAHANQARTTTFVAEARANPEDILYSPDAVTFARKYLNYTGEDDAFDFSATYDPISAFGARLADGRVWSFFREVADGMDAYLPYIQGHDLAHRMPLTVPLKAGLPKLSVNDTLWHMRSHNEGSWFDNTQARVSPAARHPQRIAGPITAACPSRRAVRGHRVR